MKKINLLLIVIFISMIVQLNVYANDNKFVVSAENTADSANVVISVNENSNISAMTLELKYDSKYMIVKEALGGDALSGGMSIINKNNENKIIISYVSIQPLNKEGVVVTVDFELNNNINEKDFPLTLDVTEAINDKFEKVDVSVEQITILNPNYKTSNQEDITKQEINKNSSSLNPQENFKIEDKTESKVDSQQESTAKSEIINESALFNKKSETTQNNNLKLLMWIIVILTLTFLILVLIFRKIILKKKGEGK